MPSFDTVVEPNVVEVKNAVEQTYKQIQSRFDFKGTAANVELKDKEITAWADSEFQLNQVRDVLMEKMAKRQVDVRLLDPQKIEKAAGDKVKQIIKVRSGIEAELAKKITTAIKASKLKVQASVQAEEVRVTGAKRDDLQSAMALLRKEFADQPLGFQNFRD